MKYQGGCHCGNVRYEVEMEVKDVISCNCSICSKKGSLLGFAPAKNFKLLKGDKFLTDYQFGKKVIHHNFCSTCGVTSFAKATGKDGVDMRAINVRCLDNFDALKLNIKEFDGKNL